MATMRKLGKAGHYFAYFYDKNRSPKRKSYPLRTTRKDVARRKLAKLEQQFERGEFDPWMPEDHTPRNVTLDEAGRRFLDSKAHLRPKSVQAYRTALNGLEAVAPPNLPASAVQPEHVRRYVLDADVSASTQRHRARHLKAFFNWCEKHGLYSANPVEGIELPKRKKKVTQYLTPAQLERLFRCIDADVELKAREGQIEDGEVLWLKDLVTLAVNTGLRRGELCNLRWSDVCFETGFLTVRNRSGRNGETFETKSGHERAIPLSPDAVDVLRRLDAAREDDLDGPVFVGYNGGPLNAEYASKKFKQYVRLAKLPESIHFHSLRHTCASWLVQRDVSLSIVQQILGHSSIQVTQRYAHLAPDVMQAAIHQAFGRGE